METEQPIAQIGDMIKINQGVEEGQEAKVIAVYTNSVAVELNRKQKDGTLARTVVNNKKYEFIDKEK